MIIEDLTHRLNFTTIYDRKWKFKDTLKKKLFRCKFTEICILTKILSVSYTIKVENLQN